MDEISIHLPQGGWENEQIGKLISTPSFAKGIIWFPDFEDYRQWLLFMGCLDRSLPTRVTIRSGNYALQLERVIGYTSLSNTCPKEACLVSLPLHGVSEDALHNWLNREQIRLRAFFRLFPKEELIINPGQISPILDLRGQMRSLFKTVPFLGLKDESPEFFQDWLSGVTRLTSLFQVEAILREEQAKFETNLRQLDRLYKSNPNGETFGESVEELFWLRWVTEQLLNRVTGINTRMTELHLSMDTIYFPRLARITKNHAEKTGKRVTRSDFSLDLGSEMLYGLQNCIPKLNDFAVRLEQSEFFPDDLENLNRQVVSFGVDHKDNEELTQLFSMGELQTLGKQVKQYLAERPPVLTLVGGFSSGKTSLLNALLLSNGAQRAFATRGTANTAIVYEISHCPDNGREWASFVFRQKIDHALAKRRLDAGKFSNWIYTNKENPTAFLKLIGAEVLEDCRIRMTPLRELRGPQIPLAAEYDRLEDIQDFLSSESKLLQKKLSRFLTINYEQADFRATINQDQRNKFMEVEKQEIYLNGFSLESDELWETFQGGSNQSNKQNARTEDLTSGVLQTSVVQREHLWIESALASFLIEKAHIQIKNPFLHLATIADTPGIGSLHDQHNEITRQYLNSAAGFILLLPTGVLDSDRAINSIRLVSEEFANNHCSLDTIAFVVNCFIKQNVTPEAEMRIRSDVHRYEEEILKYFGISRTEWDKRQSNPLQRNFFVVMLKNITAGDSNENLLGYPSLEPLVSWVENLFRTGAFVRRFENSQFMLTEEWNRRRAEILREIEQSKNADEERKLKINCIRKFVDESLPRIGKKYQNKIDDYRSLIYTDTQISIDDRAKAILSECVEDYENRDEIDRRERSLISLANGFNEYIDQIRARDPAEGWTQEIRYELIHLGVISPEMTPPNKNNLPKISSSTISYRFQEIRDHWPNFWKKVVSFFGGEDIRETKAKDIRDSWQGQFRTSWHDNLSPYLGKSSDYIKRHEISVEQECKKKIAALYQEGKYPSDFTNAILQAKLRVFDSLEKDRKAQAEELKNQITIANADMENKWERF